VGISLAVLDFEAAAPGNKDLGAQLAEILTAHLSVQDSIELVERAKLGLALSEQKLTAVGLVDADQAAKIGKLVGAKLLVTGKAFVMDKKFIIVTKVIGVETGRVVGGIKQVELDKPMSDWVGELAGEVSALVSKHAQSLLPKDSILPDPTGDIKAALGQRTLTVAVVIPEHHVTRQIPDPAAETEIKKVLLECGYKVIDAGDNKLADWARQMLKDTKERAWPAAVDQADFVIVGEAFSELAARTGELVTCAGRAEVNVINRGNGRIILADRDTRRAVDLAENIAAKTALQNCGRHLGLRIAASLVEHARKPVSSKPSTTGSAALEHLPPGIAGWNEPFLAVEFGAPASASSSAPTTKPTSRATTGPGNIAVFAASFGNETDKEQYDPVAAGMGDLLAVMLGMQPDIFIVERQKLMALTAEQALTLRGLVGQKHAVQAGKLLKAEAVLTGRVYEAEGRLMVSAQVIDLATERVLAADVVACSPAQLPEAALHLANSISRGIFRPLPKIDVAAIDRSPVAGLHFAKGLANYYGGNMDAAIMHFMQAVDMDPDYVETHYWSGMAYHRQQEWEHAVIEWERYLKRLPEAPNAGAVRALLARDRARAGESGIPRLAPTTAATKPEMPSRN
jgi:TolB-like protein